MVCERLIISGHAFQKIFQRYIKIEDVEAVINNGEIIKQYLNDKPYPSFLLLGFINGTPLHVVIAKNEAEKFCILVTAYFPDNTIWNSTFKSKII